MPDKKERTVFVLGVPRSGTSLISGHIAMHENALFFPYSTRVLYKLGASPLLSLARQMAAASAAIRPLGVQLGWERPDGGDLVWRSIISAPDTRARRALVRKHLYSRTGKRWSDGFFISKRILNVEILDVITETFPEAVYVHVKRDPFDTIQSMLHQRVRRTGALSNRWGPTVGDPDCRSDNPVVDCTIQFDSINRAIVDLCGRTSKYTVVKYEEYCANPFEELKRIFSVIGFEPPGNIPKRLEVRRREIDLETRRAILSTLKGS